MAGTKANRFFFSLVWLFFFRLFFPLSFSPFEQILRGCFNYLISELVRPFLIRELIFGPRGPPETCVVCVSDFWNILVEISFVCCAVSLCVCSSRVLSCLISGRARPNKTGTCVGRFQISLGSHGAASSSPGGGEDPVIFGASEALRRVNWVSEKFRLIIF